MTITVCSYPFEGPYGDSALLRDIPGVYLVACARDGDYYLVEVGESAEVKSRIDSHESSSFWRSSCRSGGTLLFFALYVPGMHQSGRMNIERELRNRYALS